MTTDNLLEIRQRRSAARNQNRIEEVLNFAYEKGVTLVQLEALAHYHLSPQEHTAQGIKKNRQKVNHHNRAINANRVRWQRAKDFLTGHVAKEERIAQRIETAGSMAPLLEGPVLPQPEAPFIPAKELL